MRLPAFRAHAVATVFFSSSILVCLPATAASSQAQEMPLVSAMASNEVAAHQHPDHFVFISEERSTRTGGHLWKEKVVETDDGLLRRLLAVDGVPLSGEPAAAEDRRIAGLVAHPDDFRKENQNRKDDEKHATDLLEMLPRAFLLKADGESNGCTRIAFRPNPAYQPASYEERVVHAMEGTVTLRQPVNRLCTLDAHIAQPVEFGFGLLGRVNQGGEFTLLRTPTDNAHWKTVHATVHVNGRVLMLKSLARDQEMTRSDFHLIGPHVTIAEAAQLSRP